MSAQAPTSPAGTSAKHTAEDCMWCYGTGFSEVCSCNACGGIGRLLVAQPARKCSRCGGDGRATDRTTYSYPFCIDCSGTGWSFVLRV